jgi:hypothetical protein
MKLTPEQRLLVYKELLKVVCKDSSVKHGMCYYLLSLLDNSKKMPLRWGFLLGCSKMTYLPELNKHGGNHTISFPYWAPCTKKGWETRIKWIEQAIIDVKNKIK